MSRPLLDRPSLTDAAPSAAVPRRGRARFHPALLGVLVWLSVSVGGQAPAPGVVSPASVRAHMEMLASEALRGRRAGSPDMRVAATYAASELRRAGVVPVGNRDSLLAPFDLEPDGADEGGRQGWNVVGQLPGASPSHGGEAIVLTAHLDHIGVRGEGDEVVFSGADDNASGATAVLALAEALARGSRPGRTIIFALFDAEEAGGAGSRTFVADPPVPLERIVALINFEMVGRPNFRLPPDTLWLTGYARSTLGPWLADAGARVVADPYPEQRFFVRSDNIRFARLGVVAQTLSSYDLHDDYHTPGDDLSGIDFAHMTAAIGMLVDPIRRLADSSWWPDWRPGEQPPPPATGAPGR